MRNFKTYSTNYQLLLEFLGAEQFILYLCALDYLAHPRLKKYINLQNNQISIDPVRFQLAARDSGLWPIIRNSFDTVVAANTANDKEDLELLREQARADRLSNFVRNIHAKKQVLEIVETFNDAEIDSILLKGSASLLIDLWKHPADRHLGDLDILIKESELEKAVSLLASNGYSYKQSDVLNMSTHHHFPGLYHESNTKLPVELHTRAGPERFQDDLKKDVLFKNRKALLIENTMLSVLSNEDQYRLAHLHSSHYFGNSHKYGFQLRDLVEVCLLERNLSAPTTVLIRNNDLMTKLFVSLKPLLFDDEILMGKSTYRMNNLHYFILKFLQAAYRPNAHSDDSHVIPNRKRTWIRILNNPTREIPKRLKAKISTKLL